MKKRRPRTRSKLWILVPARIRIPIPGREWSLSTDVEKRISSGTESFRAQQFIVNSATRMGHWGCLRRKKKQNKTAEQFPGSVYVVWNYFLFLKYQPIDSHFQAQLLSTYHRDNSWPFTMDGESRQTLSNTPQRTACFSFVYFFFVHYTYHKKVL